LALLKERSSLIQVRSFVLPFVFSHRMFFSILKNNRLLIHALLLPILNKLKTV
jgi:hypothetical protein